MGTSGNSARNLTHVFELFKAGMRIPVPAMEKLIHADSSVEPLLLEILRSRAVEDDVWAPLWTLIVLGERRAARAIPAILDCVTRGQEGLREGVEFALLRMGARAEEPVLRYLKAHEGSPARLHLMGVLAHLRTERAVAYLIDQFRPESKDFIPVAWLLAESGHPRAIKALESAVREFPGEPGLGEPLAARRRGEDLHNPLLGDWRTQWAWKDEEILPGRAAEEAPPEPDGRAREDSPFLPRAFDLSCPVCQSRLEFDSHTGDSRVTRPGRAIPRNGPCPCGSLRKFKKCCGKRDESPHP